MSTTDDLPGGPVSAPLSACAYVPLTGPVPDGLAPGAEFTHHAVAMTPELAQVMGSDFERCSSCGCLVVGGVALRLTRRAGLRLSRVDARSDGDTREDVLCSKPDCLTIALVVVRGFHQSAAVADVPLFPEESSSG